MGWIGVANRQARLMAKDKQTQRKQHLHDECFVVSHANQITHVYHQSLISRTILMAPHYRMVHIVSV